MESLVYTGVWMGELLEDGKEKIDLLWSLVLVSDSPYPSAYGATGHDVPNVIHGQWDNKSKEVKLKEIMPENGGVRELTGVLTDITKQSKKGKEGSETQEEKETITIIRGTWKWGERKGQFVCCKESDKSSNISGFWIGLAKPSKKLADFCIPTNPIRWCVTLLPAPLPHSENTPTIFGCGFFDDSGDIPGQNLLFYSLRGSYDAVSRKVQFTKVYESHTETAGYEISYSGVLEDDGFMRGKWDNKKGGSFGKWMCRQQKSSSKVTSAICICDKCDTAIKPGEIRWACTTCPSLWFCCGSCAREDLEKVHEHKLVPEGMYYQDTAQGSCCAEILSDSFSRFGSRDFVGWRVRDEPSFRFLTYDDVAWHTKQVVFGLREIGCRPRDFALICADLSTTYLAVVLSCIMQGLIILPVHGALVQTELEHIIRKTNPSVFFVSSSYFPKIAAAVLSVSGGPDSRKPTIIEITSSSLAKPGSGDVPVVASSHSSEAQFEQVLSLDEVREKGRKRFESKEELKVVPLAKQEISAVLFTSGSTGTPKGAIFTEDLMMPSEGVANVQPFIRVDFQSYDPSFSLSILQTMMCGGSRLFCLSLDTMLQDFQIGRPTHIGATPIFWNALYQEYLVRLSREARMNEAKVEKERKKRNELSNKVVGQVRALLGNRLIVATSGGAPISPEVLSFIKTKLRLDIIDLYGSRETGGITRDGVVYPALSIKLLDVPDLGYFSSSFPPQGEICVHSPRLISGYWNEEGLTKENFIEMEGKKYYRTGDIGETHETIEPSGKKVLRLKVIDRVSSITKLSAGEWLSTGYVESVLENSPWVSQCFIMGSPSHSFPVAIIVPSLLSSSFHKFPKDPSVRGRETIKILKEIRLWAVHHHLRPFQIPQNIFLEDTPWTVENGFLTGTEKKRRKMLQARYTSILNSLYEQKGEREESGGEGSQLSKEFTEILRDFVPNVIGITGNMTLGSIGGDSLTAARLCLSLQNNGVEVQLKNIFDYTLQHLSDLLMQSKYSIALPMSNHNFINWAEETSLPSQFKLNDKFLGEDIFMSGCTGFLGPVLLAEILQKYPAEKRVYCLVRAKNDEDAFLRIKKDMETALVWNQNFMGRIVGVAGDITKERFGLNNNSYSLLINQIGVIFHNAAWVNMALPYAGLKPTNVKGTLSIINLGLEAGGAPIHFISSVAAIPLSPPFDSFPSFSSHDIEKRDGYGQSKIVSEILLAKANAKFNIPVFIYRPSAISGHTKTGFSNKLDFINLLIKGGEEVIGGAVRDTKVMLHWVPVDFVSSVIVFLSQNPPKEQRVFNIISEGPRLKDVFDLLVGEQKERKMKLLESLSPVQWANKVESSITPQHSTLYPIKHLLKNFEWYAAPTLTNITTTSTRECIKDHLPWHEVTHNDIQKSLQYFFDSKFL